MPDKPSDLVQGTLDMLILKTLALEPMHGYGISVRIEQMSKGVFRLNAGSLFLAIQRLEMEAAEKMRQGVSRKDALREVRLERGSLEVTKELVRSGGWEFFVETCWQDLHYSVRMLRKSPGFAAVAIVTLALGIGANTAIFSLTDQILLRDLPVPHPEQLFILRSPGPNHGHTWGDVDQGAQSFSYPMYKDLRERATVFSGLLACRRITVNVSGHGQTQAAHADLISGNFFQTLEVQPVLGRLF